MFIPAPSATNRARPVVKYLAGLCFLLFLPAVAGQTTESLVDDFQDDTAGQPPQDDWYVWNNQGATTVNVVQYNPAGTNPGMFGRTLGFNQTAVSGARTVGHFSFNDDGARPDFWEWSFYPETWTAHSNYLFRFYRASAQTSANLVTATNLLCSSPDASTNKCEIAPGAGSRSAEFDYQQVIRFRWELNWTDYTYRLLYNTTGENPNIVVGFQEGNGGWIAMHGDPTPLQVKQFMVGTQTASASGAGSFAFLDNINGGTAIFGRPAAPAGVNALITLADPPGGNGGLVEIRWPISTNDPNREIGDFTYTVHRLDRFGNVVGLDDIVTAKDGDGLRYQLNEFDFTDAPKTMSFYVTALNASSGLRSGPSCIVTVDFAIAGDFDTCGDFPSALPGLPDSGFSEDSPLHQARDYFSESWGVAESVTNWLFAIAIIGMVTVGFAGISRNMIFTAVGFLLGVGLALVFGFLPLWFLFLIAFLVIALAGRQLFGSGGE